jgi:hypothetical protein
MIHSNVGRVLMCKDPATLFNGLSRAERVTLTLDMYRARVQGYAYKYFLRWTWLRHWRELLDSSADIVDMFRHAAFKLPENIGSVVMVYRGSRCPIEDAAAGMSWSLSRDVACHFAYAWKGPGQLLVIEAEVTRDKILMLDHIGPEKEVTTVPNPVTEWRVSLPENDWLDGHKRFLDNHKRLEDQALAKKKHKRWK